MATPNIKYTNSSSNYYVIMMLTNFEKISKKNSDSRCTKCRIEAKDNRDAVVVSRDTS